MDDVIGSRQLVCLQPTPDPSCAFDITECERIAHGFERMDRSQVAIRCFLPQAAIRFRRRFWTDQIDLVTPRAKPAHEDQHRFRGARPFPVTHKLENLQSRRFPSPGARLRSQCLAYFRNT